MEGLNIKTGVTNDYVKTYIPSESIVMSSSEDLIYVSDPVTNELIYTNDAKKSKCKSCFEVMGKHDGPCENCNHDELRVNKYGFKIREVDGKTYVVRESLEMWNGKEVHIAYMSDVSDSEKVLKLMSDRTDLEYTLKQCVSQINNSGDHKKNYEVIVKFVGNYYGARSSVMYEFSEDGKVIDTYKWGLISCKYFYEITSDTSLSFFERPSLKPFTNEHRIAYIDDIELLKDVDNELYTVFKDADINSFIFGIMKKNGRDAGTIFLSNPTIHLSDFTVLTTMLGYVANEIIRQQLWKERTYELTHDIMTGSYNRVSYVEFINEIKETESLGLILADVNGLKKVNDNIGFDYGDTIVVQIADILKEVFDGYPVFRFGGDEFTICCADISKEDFMELVQEAQKRLKQHECGAALGYVWDDFDIDIKRMIKNAEQILVLEKRKIYEETMPYMESHNKVTADIINLIENENFKVYLQPKFNIETSECCGAEALIRLEHPEYGLVSPAKFIPILEKMGNIHRVDLFVFEKVCKLLSRMKEEGRKVFPISFNFSKITLLEDDIFEKVEEISDRYNISRDLLEIEITETIGDIENDKITHIANEFHKRGFRLSMDDFGTQYSSISVLSLMRFDILKIDRSMVNNLIENDISRKVIKHIIAMCIDLGIECIAEGVETLEQAEFLNKVNCKIAQGYYYGKPAPENDFEKKYM